MDNEIKDFLQFNDDEIESESIKQKAHITIAFYKKVILSVIAIIIFSLTAYFGFLLNNDDKISEEITSHLSSDTIKADEKSSEKYKIKTFDYLDNNTLVLYGKLNITKEDLKSLGNDELHALFCYVVSSNNYNWITVNFSDGTGIIVMPENSKTFFYGATDKKGLITETYGLILSDGENKYSYVSVKDTNDNISNKSHSDKASDKTDESADTVYITASGTKYHILSCSYLTENKTSVSLSKAKEQGYTPCSRCIK